MNKEDDFHRDEFIKELLKHADLEEPSDQFTKKVMDKVMQEWLAKPIKMRKPVSGKQWIGIVGVVAVVFLVLLGTDVHTIVESLNHPFFEQLDAVFLKPLNQILAQVFDVFVKLPAIVYIITIVSGVLAILDQVINKFLQYR